MCFSAKVSIIMIVEQLRYASFSIATDSLVMTFKLLGQGA